MKKKIIFYHMLNDFSGSPHILSLIIKYLSSKGYQLELYTSNKNEGFLSNIPNIKYHIIPYKFTNNRLTTLLRFIYAQVLYFVSIFKYQREKNTVFYLNTILPFGAAIGASLFSREIIYHIHEKPIKNNLIQNIGISIFNKFGRKSIFVSEYLIESFNVNGLSKNLVYNSLSEDFTNAAYSQSEKKKEYILMVCSLRVFKGVNIFLNLAKALPEYSFKLVLNAEKKEIDSYFSLNSISQNLRIFGKQNNLHPFYIGASIVLNLSITDLIIETFGLTILESLTYGVPVVVPPIGGIAELIEDGVHGFKVDSKNEELLIEKIKLILNDSILYDKMSKEAKLRSQFFSHSKMMNQIEKVINETSYK